MKAKNFLFGVWADTHGAYAYAQVGEKKRGEDIPILI